MSKEKNTNEHGGLRERRQSPEEQVIPLILRAAVSYVRQHAPQVAEEHGIPFTFRNHKGWWDAGPFPLKNSSQFISSVLFYDGLEDDWEQYLSDDIAAGNAPLDITRGVLEFETHPRQDFKNFYYLTSQDEQLSVYTTVKGIYAVAARVQGEFWERKVGELVFTLRRPRIDPREDDDLSYLSPEDRTLHEAARREYKRALAEPADAATMQVLIDASIARYGKVDGYLGELKALAREDESQETRNTNLASLFTSLVIDWSKEYGIHPSFDEVVSEILRKQFDHQDEHDVSE